MSAPDTSDNSERMIMDVLGIILAGGKGERLYPLTEERSKPAVPIGGKYRLIDFVLSNFANSGIESIYVLTLFKALSLMRHLEEGWRVSDFRNDRFLTVVPAQMRVGSDWYQGTADAAYQNINLIERHRPELVVIFGADHIYRMNVQRMIDHHRAAGADVSVAVLPVDIEMASRFGIVEVDEDWRVRAFDEKPAAPKAIPGEPSHALVSMGNYVFNTDFCWSFCSTMLTKAIVNMISVETSCRRCSGAISSWPMTSAKTACRWISRAKKLATGATWARSNPISRRTWTRDR
jgi:glucose-1-phosphate adenylyltransferase